MRAALFERPAEDDVAMGALAETAIFAQWFHNVGFLEQLHYAHWSGGEADIEALKTSTQKPDWCVEVKWSDRPSKDPRLLRHLITFAKEHEVTNKSDACGTLVTTRIVHKLRTIDGVEIEFVPSALYAYVLGKNV